MLKDINPTPAIGSGPGNFIVVGNQLFFTASDANGTELWKTDGTTLGTVMVKDINTNPSTGYNPGSLIAFNNELYFSANDGVSGIELWKSDGTPSGTILLKDIAVGTSTSSSSPAQLTVSGNTLYFKAWGRSSKRYCFFLEN